jgi:hypothetical protein
MADSDHFGERLRDYWDDILGPRPEAIEQRLVRELGLPHPGRFTLATSSGKTIVTIDPDGKITFGEGVKPDEAAELFWTNMALKRVGMEQRLQSLAIMEAMLIRMGRADLNYERAALAAEAEGATENERAVAERAHMNLQAIVHQLMDYARGLARRPAAGQAPTPQESAPRAILRPPGLTGDPSCPTCHGEGRILGDCGDSPNVWFDPCPSCSPTPPDNPG